MRWLLTNHLDKIASMMALNLHYPFEVLFVCNVTSRRRLRDLLHSLASIGSRSRSHRPTSRKSSIYLLIYAISLSFNHTLVSALYDTVAMPRGLVVIERCRGSI